MSNGQKSLVHGLVSVVLFALPLVINLSAPWESLHSQITSEQKKVGITFHNNIVQTCVVTLATSSGSMTNMQGSGTTREIPCRQPIPQ
jgi:hypothetical protein